MGQTELLRYVDHTCLSVDATWDNIRQLCDEGMEFQTASVCIPPVFVKQAADYVAGRIPICTVIGFPNGTQTTAVKVFEAEDAVRNGASELDMVISVGRVKEGNFAAVQKEIAAVRAACQTQILKVIVEACLLTEKEKETLCQVVTDAGADYIKTSTGFAFGGAEEADVALFARCVGEGVRIKAAGGIRTPEAGIRFLHLGADRIGSSGIVACCKKMMQKGQ